MPTAQSKPTTEEVANAEEMEKVKAMKLKVKRGIFINLFQAVIQHVICVQSEQHLFIQAHGGDVTKSSQTMSATTALVGVFGLVFNQLGGRLSDAYGRKPFFAIGPLMNILVGLLVFKNPCNRLLLAATKVMKLMGTTFSGSVVSSAVLGETLDGQEMAIASTELASYIGMAVVIAPFLESLILRIANGRHKVVYLALAIVAGIQLVSNQLTMPETLRKPVPFNLSKTMEALNPLDSLQVFTKGSRTHVRLMVIWMFQMLLEGKNLSDFSQIWMREHIKWSPNSIRNQVAWYGLATTMSGLHLTPAVLRRMSPMGFTTLANVLMAVSFGMLSSTSGLAMVLCIIPQALGVNGASAAALNPIMKSLAISEGFEQGQYAAYTNNLRAVPSILSPLGLGALYAYVKRKNMYPGVMYPTLGLFGAVIPTVLLWTVVDRSKMKLS